MCILNADNHRIPMQLLNEELSVGSRPQYKPKKRFKYCVKDSLALCKIDVRLGMMNNEPRILSLSGFYFPVPATKS